MNIPIPNRATLYTSGHIYNAIYAHPGFRRATYRDLRELARWLVRRALTLTRIKACIRFDRGHAGKLQEPLLALF